MQILKTTAGPVIAVGHSITEDTDNYYCDGTVLPKSVVGSCTITVGELPPPQVPAVVPAAISMRQARLALLQAGLLATVNSTIAGMAGTAGESARIEWEYATEVRRDNQLVAALAPTLTLTDAQIDALFVAAAGL